MLCSVSFYLRFNQTESTQLTQRGFMFVGRLQYIRVYIYILRVPLHVYTSQYVHIVCVSRLMIRFHTIPLAVTADYCIRRQIPALHDYKQYVFTQAFVRTQCLQSVMQGLCPSCQSWPWPRTLDPFWLEGCYRPVSMSFVKM